MLFEAADKMPTNQNICVAMLKKCASSDVSDKFPFIKT